MALANIVEELIAVARAADGCETCASASVVPTPEGDKPCPGECGGVPYQARLDATLDVLNTKLAEIMP